MTKKTKIVCTLGPASSDPEIIKDMLLSGMNVARFNFSHGTHEDHLEAINRFRDVRNSLGLPAAVLMDTKGPEIRIGDFENKKIDVTAGMDFTLTTGKILGDSTRVSVSYKDLPSQVKAGDKILIDDGFIVMKVVETTDTEIRCKAENSGSLSNRKGVNIPGASLDLEYLSDQDKSDLLFGIEMGVDYIAASFVRSMKDVLDLKAFLTQNGGNDIKIISKIENLEGINDFDNILEVSDGIMVARGDMGVEVDFERLPGIQKQFIYKCCKAGKPVITATQMLESMTENPSPTRAEITDVANAIFDGTSAVMLSGESAAGKYPVESVKTMTRIINQAEKDFKDINYGRKINFEVDFTDISNAIGHAACTTAADIKASALIAVTSSGYTALKMAKYRPDVPVIAASSQLKTYHQQSLNRGVIPLMIDSKESWRELMIEAVERAKKMEYIKDGDSVVISAGMPINTSGTTNLIRVIKA